MSSPPLPQTAYSYTASRPHYQRPLSPAPGYALLTSPPIAHHPPLLATLSLSLPPTSFIFSASPLLFHPRSSRIALVHDTSTGKHFLPRGRKDVGEPLAACALREGFEESGFRGELIPWGGGPGGTLQPRPPGSYTGIERLQTENKEAFWVQAQPMATRSGIIMYFTYYFLAIIPEDDPVPDKGKDRLVGMHESGYEGILVPVEKAIELLSMAGGREDGSLAFVAEEKMMPEVSELVRSGKIWKEMLGGEWEDDNEDDPVCEGEDEDAEDGEKDVWKSGPVWRKSDILRIDKDTAKRLEEEGKGRVVPCPVNGGDDGVVQARVVYEAWRRLKKVHDWK
ncbi:hypothetical protein BGX38DRAFT_1271420 [Terfezia claveryi]|nr:hypothetical protein BGX38DRAFT_1271420 [Terfezia claveryi]